MNTIFDFKRIGLLVQRLFIERFSRELMFWGVSIICMMFLRNSIEGILGFAIAVCIFRTGQSFREIHSSTNRINYFMIPATQIEKFTVSILYTVVYFWVMMFIVYIVGNIAGTWIQNLLANINILPTIFDIHPQNLHWVVFDTITWLETGSGKDHVLLTISLLILIIQSLFLLGSIYFKKNQIMKTVLVLAGFSLFLFLLCAFEAKYLYVDLFNKAHIAKQQGYSFNRDEIMAMTDIIVDIFFYLLVPYLWLTSYIRLTEKEV
ncbi:hypothetical protein FACS189451_11580 [Bacteroidia bacterium]|nr:hypothetical protein FACS189451_11580 [Bacteroidia bacterium]